MLERWYYQMLMEEFGPVEEMTICQLIEDGTLSNSDLVRAEDSAEWITVVSRSWSVSGDGSEPDAISDLSELSFDFEESTPSDRRAGQEISGPLRQHVPPEYYSQSLGQILGPMSMEDLIGMAESGALSGSDEVRCGEDSEWQLAGAITELQGALSLGEQLTAKPVASAPPSTRRLFPTAGRPSEDSANQVNVTNPVGATLQADEPLTEQVSVAEKVATAAAIAASREQAGSPKTDKPPEQKKETEQNDQREAKAKPKKSKKKKPNQEDDKLLNEIFDDVFADEQKAVRSGMPPTSVTASAPKSSPKSAATSVSDPGTLKESETHAKAPSPVVNAVTAKQSTPLAPPPALEVSQTPVPTTAAASPELAPAALAAAAPAITFAPSPSAPSRRSFSFSFDGPIRSISIGLVVISLAAGLIWQFGLPFTGGVRTGTYSTRMSEVLAQYKAMGEDPQPAAWQDLSLKSRTEFMLYYKTMLEAGVSGAKNVACMEGLKSMIALASSKPDEKEKRQELLGKIEKSLADMNK